MSRPARFPLSFGVFLVAMVTLMVELMLIRVFDVVLVDNIGYLVISCALFAFGLAGVYATLRPLTDHARIESYLAWLSVALAASCVLQLPLLNVNPFNLKLIIREPVIQLFYFLLIYLTVILPFFFAGLILATTFSVYAAQIRRLYFFDLVGAAIGAVINVPLIRPLGPGGLMFVATALALLAAALFRGRTRFALVAVAAGVACIAVPLSRSDGYYDFVPHIDKRGVMEALEAGEIEQTVWDPVSKVDVIPAPDNPSDRAPAKFIHYDGGTQSTTLFAFDGDFEALRRELDQSVDHASRHFWNRAVPLAHWLKADTGAEVLIIGSAGGQETKAALTYGASRVDAIEMVAAVVDLVTGPFSEYIGGLFHDPRVHVQVGEGRTFLRGTDETYDIIQIFSNYTSSSISSGNGAAATNYLQTADAYVEYFTHLKPNGVIQINHNLYPRLITTAALAWQWLGRTDFRKHVVVYERESETLPTILIKTMPWTADELARLNAHMLAPNPGNPYLVMENPLDPASSLLSDDFYDRPEAGELTDLVDYVIRPTTDDRPYFNFIRRSLEQLDPASSRFLDQGTAAALNSQLKAGMPNDVVHFFLTGAAALLFALVFVLVPLLLSPAGRSRWPNMFTAMFYFSCLGAGFIIIELTLIQIFIKLIGFPLYAYSVVIFTMLLAAGLGSLSADRFDISPTRRWAVPFIGLLLCGAVLWWVHPLVFGYVLAMPMAVRILIGAIMILPMGFFMGMPLPLGILTLAEQPRGAVAWAWAMNGLFTVIGGLIAAIGSIYLGFKMLLLIGFAIYIAAGLAFLRLHRIRARGGALPIKPEELPSAEPA